ncbi:peptidase family M12A-domain-containing protein [Colletotrichum cereale]|nr:peptidase family M12A-domain-containing protein [Colletotrichum cereale]
MPSITLKAAAAMALALSQPVLAGVFPADTLYRSEFEAMPLEKRGSMNATLLWDKGKIPYILKDLPHELSEVIRDAMRQWQQGTCIRFLPKADDDKAWMRYTKKDGYCSALGRGAPASGEYNLNLDYPDWVQKASLSTGCMGGGVPTYLLGNAIGLINEAQRPDRDQFIKVNWINVSPAFSNYFKVVPEANTSVPFDYNSIMMYEPTAYSIRLKGDKTLDSTTNKKIAPATSPTANDFLAINQAYGCEDYTTRTVPECRTVAINADGNHSSYSFILDEQTEKFMLSNGYTHLAVHQNCRANQKIMATDNWGFTPLNGWGPKSQYQVTTDRCKKDFDRQASRYEVALCKGDNEGACDVKCGLRRICPYDASGKQVDSKAVNVVDDTLWVCHPL